MSHSSAHPPPAVSTEPTLVALVTSREAKNALKTLTSQLIVVPSQQRLARQTTGLSPRLSVVEAAAVPDLAEVLTLLRKTWPVADIVVWAPRAAGNVVKSAFQAGAKDVVLSSTVARLQETVEQVLDQQQFLPWVDELAKKRARGLQQA